MNFNRLKYTTKMSRFKIYSAQKVEKNEPISKANRLMNFIKSA